MMESQRKRKCSTDQSDSTTKIRKTFPPHTPIKNVSPDLQRSLLEQIDEKNGVSYPAKEVPVNLIFFDTQLYNDTDTDSQNSVATEPLSQEEDSPRAAARPILGSKPDK